MRPIVFEPFRIKVIEPIRISTPDERQRWIEDAGYNVFNLRSDQVMVDLLTDSGTAAMSQEQWSAMMSGDETYAGSKSFFELEAAARDVFQQQHIIPVHQGRAAEHLVFTTLLQNGMKVPSNGHFDTTRANILDNGAEPVNLPIAEARDPFALHPFKGNMDTKALDRLLAEHADAVPFVMLSLTNNTCGGQPVSLENIEHVADIAKQYRKELFLDGCRFAENAYFIKLREPGCAGLSPREITRRCFRHGTLVLFSAKKDAFANIGGLVCLSNGELAEKLKDRLIVTEGFPTYGGLAGRDLAAIARGLEEVLEEDYLRYRLRTIEWVVERLKPAGIPVLQPAGGHGFYIDAASFLPHVKPEHLPGITLLVEIYIRGGIRGVELGNVAFGSRDTDGNHVFPPLDLVRFALPRRVYTEAHIEYVVEHIIELHRQRDHTSGFTFANEAKSIRHFRSRFARV